VQDIKKTYDLIIIGAGPAGLNAGLHALKAGFSGSMLLVDKTTPWSSPIPCAEGVGRLGCEEAVDVKKSWIRQEIFYACFHSPNGSTITYKDNDGGYIINRAAMQQDMADQLASSGVQCVFNRKVSRILPPENGIRTIIFSDEQTTSARVIIDASGPICGLGKGEKISYKPADLEPAYFVWVENIKISPDSIQIYAGQNLAPGGYAWVFPRGENGANIGIVVGKAAVTKCNIRNLLDDFIAKKYPDVKIIQRYAGPIPCGFKKVPFAIPGLIKAGDAASTINPISRAGISEALLCGALAGGSSVKMLRASTTIEMIPICKEYQKTWRKKRGDRHYKLAKVKSALLAVPDSAYNKGIETLSSISPDELTMPKIFRAALGKFPRLVWALRHLM
jgi:geranylgeranyl reductase family protein